MPGAYEKVPTGEHFELLQSTVQKCRRAIEKQNFAAAGVELAALFILQSDKSRKRIEEFVFAGGLDLEFLILSSGSETLVKSCLKNFSELFAVIHDPFDDDIPPLPLLTFFLCQRHSHYVDIHWSHHEIVLMARFMDAHLCVLRRTDLSVDEKRMAIDSLTIALRTFPVHRVSPSAAAVFTADTCRLLLDSIRNILLPDSHLTAAQLLLAAVPFGAGEVVVGDLPLAQLLMHSGTILLPGMRCSCGRCEFYRRLRKMAAEHDEFGVAAAAGAKRSIATNFIRAGLFDLLAEIIRQATKSTACDPETPESTDVAELEKTDESSVHLVPPGELCLRSARCSPRDLTRHIAYLLVHYAHVSWRRLGETPLLMTAAGKNVWASMVESLESEKQLVHNGLVKPHVRTALEVMACLVAGLQDVLNSRKADIANEAQRLLTEELQPAGAKFLDSMNKGFSQVTLDNWKPEFINCCGPFLAVLFIQYLNQSSSPRGFRDNAELSCEVKDVPAAVAVCTITASGWQRRGVAQDERTAAFVLVACGAMLVGGVALGRCRVEARRRFLPPPDPVTGPLLECARFVWSHFDNKVSTRGQAGKCLIIKSLASLIITRAEMASAVVPAIEGAKPVLTVPSSLIGRRISRKAVSETEELLTQEAVTSS